MAIYFVFIVWVTRIHDFFR